MEAILLILKILSWGCFAMSILFLCVIVKIKFLTPKKAIPQQKQIPPNKTGKTKPKIKMLNRDGDAHEDEWHTYIAGVRHHASKYDIGGFCGYVANDAANSHDPKAMGIYNSFKLLGYIPAKELEDYRYWSDVEAMPCAGFIYLEDGQMRGRVKILRPCNKEFLATEFSRYLQWVKDNFGSEYLPKTMNMSFETE